eukprot:g5320.t1
MGSICSRVAINVTAALSQAKLLYDQGAVYPARTQLEGVLRAAPSSAEAHNMLGLVHLARANLTAAVSTLRRGVLLAHTSGTSGAAGGGRRLEALVRSNLGVALVQSNEPAARAEAAVLFTDAVQLDPALASAHANLGYFTHWHDRRDVARAEAALLRATALDPADALGWYFLGCVLVSSCHTYRGCAAAPLRRGAESLRRAVRLAPQRADVQAEVGVALAFLGDVAGAVAHSRRAVALRPTHGVALYNIGRLMYDFAIDGVADAHGTALAHFRRAQAVLAARLRRRLVRGVGAWALEQGVRTARLLPRADGDRDGSGGRDGAGSLGAASGAASPLYLYGQLRPHALRPSDLHALALRPHLRAGEGHSLLWERELYVARFSGPVWVGGRAGIIHDERRVFVPSHGELMPLTGFRPAGSVAARGLRVLRRRRLASIMQMSCHNYYHLVAECLGRLVLLLRHVLHTEPALPVLVPVAAPGSAGMGRLARDVFGLLGLRGTRGGGGGGGDKRRELLYYEDDTLVEVTEELVYVDWQVRTGSPAGLELTPPRAGPRLLRALVLQARLRERERERRGQRGQRGPAGGEAGETVVFVSRNGDGKLRRALLNEPAVIAAARRAGRAVGRPLVVFYGTNSTLRGTVDLFGRAAAIVGVHGAGLVNMVFARSGTPVVEIVSLHPSHRMFMHMAYALGLPYWVVTRVPPNVFEKSFAAPADDVGATLALALERRAQESGEPGPLLPGQHNGDNMTVVVPPML